MQREEIQKRRKVLILVFLSVAQLMIVLDFSIVNVALPSIQEQFGIMTSDLQWIISAYALTFGGFLLLGGRISDFFDRKNVFIAGLIIFTISSLAGGLAPSGIVIIMARAFQGVGAAILQPTALSLVTVTFKEGRERNWALGIFSSMAAIGFTLGVILGGALTSFFTWHWVFFVNVPIGGFVLLATLVYLPPQKKTEETRSSDTIGAVLATATLSIMVLGITRFDNLSNWFEGTILIAVAAVFGYFFVRWEARVKDPLIPLQVFRNPTLVIAITIMFLSFAANVALPFIISLYLQVVRGLSPIATGLVFIPAGVGGMTGAVFGPRLVNRIDTGKAILTGSMLFAAGVLIITFITPSSSLVLLMAGYYVTGLGLVTVIVATTIAAMAGVRPSRQGLTAGLLNTSQQMGSAIGVSIASVVASTIASIEGGGLIAVTNGYRASIFVSLGLVIIACIVAAIGIRRRYTEDKDVELEV